MRRVSSERKTALTCVIGSITNEPDVEQPVRDWLGIRGSSD